MKVANAAARESMRARMANVSRTTAPARSSLSPTKASPPGSSKLVRAQAIFYDDNMVNFAGNVERGKVPAIRAVHCGEPLTTAQLRNALAVWHESEADPSAPKLFFFFDFDGTLSLEQGLDDRLLKGVNSVDPVLATLFGDDERQEALRMLLRPLLEAGRCYVLTANIGFAAIAHLLNLLLARGKGAVGSPPAKRSGMFAVEKTVRYVPSGQKIRAIGKIIDACGCKLVASF